MKKPNRGELKILLNNSDKWYTENIGDFDQDQADFIEILISISKEYFVQTFERSEKIFKFEQLQNSNSELNRKLTMIVARYSEFLKVKKTADDRISHLEKQIKNQKEQNQKLKLKQYKIDNRNRSVRLKHSIKKRHSWK